MGPEWLEVEVDSRVGPIAAMDWGGTGDPLLLLHGGGANAAEWAPVVDHLRDAFRCISFDSYGHGRTPALQPPTFDLLLDEVTAVIDHFRLPRHRLTLVGDSFGGAKAVAHEALRPGCRAVVGLDSTPTADLGRRPDHVGAEHTADDYRARGWGWSGDHAAFEARVAEWVALGEPEPYSRRAHVLGTDHLYHAVPVPEVLAALHNLGLRPDNPFAEVVRFAELRCPVLLLCASEGMAAGNRPFVDSMPSRFPTVTVEWLQGGHGLARETPELVALRIKRFLE